VQCHRDILRSTKYNFLVFLALASGNVSDKQATCSSEIHKKGEQKHGMPLAFIVYLYPAILPDKQRDQVLKTPTVFCKAEKTKQNKKQHFKSNCLIDISLVRE